MLLDEQFASSPPRNLGKRVWRLND